MQQTSKRYKPFAPDAVIAIGCGGIGMQVVLNVARYMAFKKEYQSVPLLLVDGDSFEDHNQARQFFTKPGNKATVTGELLGRLFPLLLTEVYPYFVAAEADITEVNIEQTVAVDDLIPERSIILVGVDNHPTRKLISSHVQGLRDVLVINGGNELTTGSVHVYLRINGKEITSPIEVSDPAVAEPGNDAPFMVNCVAAAQRGQGQLLFVNMLAASLMLGCLFGFEEGRLRTGTIHFDLLAQQGGLLGPAAMLSS